MLSDILRSGCAGAVFGAALTASRVFLPTVIIDQMRLRDFHMLEVFLTASASSALIMLAFERAGIAQRSIRSNSTLGWFSAYDGNIIGGALLGAGMSLTGACPGTVLPQLVQGVPSSQATAAGAILGGVAYAKIGKSLKAETNTKEIRSQPGPQTIASKFKLSPQTVLLTYELIIGTVMAASLLSFPGKSFTVIPTVTGGLLIGLAQAVSIYLTSNSLGASMAYEQIGQYFWRTIGFTDVGTPSNPPKSVIFVLGIMLGSLLTGQILPPVTSDSLVPVETLQAILGGFILTFGARIAGGCTSGHGLSGLSSLSFSSLITTAAMFGSGILAQMVLSGV